jgi:hypothetical protein
MRTNDACFPFFVYLSWVAFVLLNTSKVQAQYHSAAVALSA